MAYRKVVSVGEGKFEVHRLIKMIVNKSKREEDSQRSEAHVLWRMKEPFQNFFRIIIFAVIVFVMFKMGVDAIILKIP